jgi:hypothetical protein
VTTAAPTLDAALAALHDGRLDDAIATLEGLADGDVVGSGVAFDRGVAYAERAKSPSAREGDLGRAAHAFEEALRRDPHDGEAQRALDAVRREIARRDGRNAHGSARGETVASAPIGRTIATALPVDAWLAVTLGAAGALATALAVRPRLDGGRRLAATVVAATSLLVGTMSAIGGLSAREIHAHVHEAVVVRARAAAIDDDGAVTIDLHEGARVDLLEERASSSRVRVGDAEGWVARDALRALPPVRP